MLLLVAHADPAVHGVPGSHKLQIAVAGPTPLWNPSSNTEGSSARQWPSRQSLRSPLREVMAYVLSLGYASCCTRSASWLRYTKRHCEINHSSLCRGMPRLRACDLTCACLCACLCACAPPPLPPTSSLLQSSCAHRTSNHVASSASCFLPVARTCATAPPAPFEFAEVCGF